MNMEFDIKDLLLSVTSFCLGSCAYCNLKSLSSFEYDKETTVRDIEKLFRSKYLDGLENIHLTGGEPILSPKLWEIALLIKKYHRNVRINIPVSGFFPYATYRYIKKIQQVLPQIRVDISIDATTKEVHEKTRGQGSWESLLKTIELLRTIQDLKVQMQLTLMETNYKEIRKVQNWATTSNMGFYLCFPHWGTRFGHEEDKSHEHSQQFIDEVERQIIDGWCKIRPLNTQIWKCQKAIWEGKKVYHNCLMGLKSIDVSPLGDVYPCMCYYEHQKFGNIREKRLTDILESEQTEQILQDIKDRKCQPCIMPVCPWKSNFAIEE